MKIKLLMLAEIFSYYWQRVRVMASCVGEN